jgi:hypothetical protein
VTTTEHKFANNFELGAINGLFEEIQKKYETILEMAPGSSDERSFDRVRAEIDDLYRQVKDCISTSQYCAKDAIFAQFKRIFPDAETLIAPR